MKIGLGLPISDPAALLTWARRAEDGPFSTLGLLDRLVYDNPEPMVALAAIAGATTRIRVQTEVLLAPLRDTALLAKQVATLDRISAGRFTLGLGVGTREDDFLAAGYEFHTRGARLNDQLAELRADWSDSPTSASATSSFPTSGYPAPGSATYSFPTSSSPALGSAMSGSPVPSSATSGSPTSDSATSSFPAPDSATSGSPMSSYAAPGSATSGSAIGPKPHRPGGPEILFGGFRPAALRRVATWGDGFLCAAAPDWAGQLLRSVERFWHEAGRPGRPRLVGQLNVAIDAHTADEARHAILRYYGEHGDRVAGQLHTDPRQVRESVAAFGELGADEVILYCWSADPAQVDRLAEIV